MKQICRETYRLIPEGIDQASEKLISVLDAGTGLGKKDALRIRLSMEEILLNWMKDDEGHGVLLQIKQHGKKLTVSLTLMSPYRNIEKNPLKSQEEFGNRRWRGPADGTAAGVEGTESLPAVIIRKLLPTYLIALSTASSTAAFTECTAACVEKLGIKKIW